MTASDQPPGVDHLVAAFHTFRYSVFRLETLQVYAGSGEDEGIAAFHRGDPEPPPDPVEDEWAARLRANRDAGRIQQRVHVVTEPFTDYLAYELTWEYGLHAAAGEDIRIIPVTGRWPDDVPRSDFTLFDSRLLFQLNYAPDGTWLGSEVVTKPRDRGHGLFYSRRCTAPGHAWAEYMTRHPALLRRLPKGT